MAWNAIRTLVESWLATATIPFYSTVNEEQHPSDPLWMTVLYGFGGSQNLSYCRERLENGSFTLVIYGTPGQGQTPVITAAETVKNHLMAQTDPLNKLEIINYSQPIEFTVDAVPWYGCEMIFEYTYT